MFRIADKRKKRSDKSEKHERSTSESLKRKDEEEERETGRQHKGKCIGCQRKGHGYMQCPCRNFVLSSGTMATIREDKRRAEDGTRQKAKHERDWRK